VLQKHAAIGFTFAIAMGCLWKFGVAERRKQIYVDFYKTYDEKKAFDQMVKAGIFQSVKPDGKPGSL
jgi:hypothetical protein